MVKKWYKKGSVLSAFIAGTFSLIAAVIIYHSRNSSQIIARLEKENQKLEIQLAPFRALASNRFGKNDKQSMNKLLEEIKKEQTLINEGIGILNNSFSILISPLQREYSYSLAMIRVLSNFVKNYGPGGGFLTQSYSHSTITERSRSESNFQIERTFNDRIIVKVSSDEKKMVGHGYVENITEDTIEIVFLKTVSNSKIPRKIILAMKTTKRGSEFSKYETKPGLDVFSPMELLIELNLAGFSIVDLVEVNDSQLLLQIRNQDDGSIEGVKVEFIE